MTTTGERPSAASGVTSTVVAVGNPAAGADWSYALTRPMTLIAVQATLTTAIAVANRQPQLKLATSTPATLFLSPLTVAQAASLADTYVWFASAPLTTVASATATSPIPTITLGTGWTVATQTTALQGADQWSSIVLTFAG